MLVHAEAIRDLPGQGLKPHPAPGGFILWTGLCYRPCVGVVNIFILPHTDPTRSWRQRGFL